VGHDEHGIICLDNEIVVMLPVSGLVG